MEELDRQETEELFKYSIVVVDNDRSKSAESVVSEFRRTSSIEITYWVEAEQNIALARNKALANTTGDFIGFLDDDEFPMHDWLLTYSSDAFWMLVNKHSDRSFERGRIRISSDA